MPRTIAEIAVRSAIANKNRKVAAQIKEAKSLEEVKEIAERLEAEADKLEEV
jgi:hypothetical protein